MPGSVKVANRNLETVIRRISSVILASGDTVRTGTFHASLGSPGRGAVLASCVHEGEEMKRSKMNENKSRGGASRS